MGSARRSVGPEGDDKRVWDVCLYEAWKAACDVGKPVSNERELEVARDLMEEAPAIRTVLLAAIVLEGRLKQVLVFLDPKKNTPAALREKSLQQLVGVMKGTRQLWTNVKPNLDSQGLRDLDDLVKLRDAIAHANISNVRDHMRTGNVALLKAARIYNLVINIMAMLNTAVKYWPDGDTGDEDWKRQGCLKLKVKPPTD